MSATSVLPAATSPWPVLALLLNALVWGLSWWPFRVLQGHGLHPLWATVVVYGLAALAILAWRPGAAAQIVRQPALWLLALGSGATNAAFNWAVSIGDVVRVVLLFYLMPLWSVLLARVVLHEHFTPHTLLRVGLALAGAAIVLKPEGAAWPLPRGLADWLGLFGGFAFAFNSVMLRRLAPRTQEEGRAVAMLFGCVLVAGVLASALSAGGVAPWPPALQAGWAWVAVAMAGAFMLSNLAYQYGAARLPASVTSVVMLTEVVFASASSIAVGGAAPDGRTLLGALLIVGAALLAAVGPARWGRGRRRPG
ncbi:DMT family transporter [Caldimonas brevitalea]|uniref:Membrane protein n=1 Tax=Caldimonas brevitalea TaxID=413882 RepID=A0A0G3BRJ8_9BURK|nr:DMT family transporter [Caldimonas brevitalea]AKJ32042.1 membrane protein [Caldimonas brevitalea]